MKKLLQEGGRTQGRGFVVKMLASLKMLVPCETYKDLYRMLSDVDFMVEQEKLDPFMGQDASPDDVVNKSVDNRQNSPA